MFSTLALVLALTASLAGASRVQPWSSQRPASADDGAGLVQSYADLGVGTCALASGGRPTSEILQLITPAFLGTGESECRWRCSQKSECHGFVYRHGGAGRAKPRQCRHVLDGPLKLKRVKDWHSYNGHCMVKPQHVGRVSTRNEVVAPRQERMGNEAARVLERVASQDDAQPAPSVEVYDMTAFDAVLNASEDGTRVEDLSTFLGEPLNKPVGNDTAEAKKASQEDDNKASSQAEVDKAQETESNKVPQEKNKASHEDNKVAIDDIANKAAVEDDVRAEASRKRAIETPPVAHPTLTGTPEHASKRARVGESSKAIARHVVRDILAKASADDRLASAPSAKAGTDGVFEAAAEESGSQIDFQRLRQWARDMLLTASEDGRLAEVLAATLSSNKSSDSEATMRQATRRLLIKASEDGRLANALNKSDDDDHEAAIEELARELEAKEEGADAGDSEDDVLKATRGLLLKAYEAATETAANEAQDEVESDAQPAREVLRNAYAAASADGAATETDQDDAAPTQKSLAKAAGASEMSRGNYMSLRQKHQPGSSGWALRPGALGLLLALAAVA